ncbi:family 1 glycosylhydrolase [Kitasatospora sp. NPDC006697]|uniref:family 1 glycosylhydrolase n=1 Tax=Kitasatospora sp. NPDC006697 TaxID=3364020 RepID=UPI0036BE5311
MFACAEGTPFPDDFLFGVASSAHQTEGGNTASDWWRLEHRPGTPLAEPSGDAADSYHRWPVDMDLLAELGFTDYRFGIEWARIEPEPGRFSRAALAHYRRMVEGAVERGLRPMVTLLHHTVPRWFAERGGWTAPDAADRFARYATVAAPVLGDGVRHVCTIAEANLLAARSTPEPFPQGTGFPLPATGATEALIESHRAAVAAVKAVSPAIRSGWSVAVQGYQPASGTGQHAAAYRRPREDVFIEAARADDWIGVQAGSRTRVGPLGPLPVPPAAETTLTGEEYYPAALGRALRHTAALVDTPIIVTGHGIATREDHRRVAYTHRALQDLARALADGLDIRGYLHRSALDGYEWGSHRPAFGLIAVEPHSFLRVPKPSAHWLGRIARSRRLPDPRPPAQDD